MNDVWKSLYITSFWFIPRAFSVDILPHRHIKKGYVKHILLPGGAGAPALRYASNILFSSRERRVSGGSQSQSLRDGSEVPKIAFFISLFKQNPLNRLRRALILNRNELEEQSPGAALFQVTTRPRRCGKYPALNWLLDFCTFGVTLTKPLFSF